MPKHPSTDPTVHQFIPEMGFVRLPTILSVYPVGRSTWWAGVKAGRYPKSIKLSPGVTVWEATAIRRLLDEQASAKAA